MEEGGALRDARSLLHRVRHDDDREFWRSSSISSSILAVAIGSSAEQGSSIRMTSGPTAMARAMHRALLLAARQAGAGICRAGPSLLPTNRLACRLVCTISSRSALDVDMPWIRRTVGHVLIDRFRERVGLLEHHADLGRATARRPDRLIVDIEIVDLDLAGHPAAIGIVSFIRLIQRRKVDLPQPDGPMKAITRTLRNVDIDISFQRVLVAVIDIDVARDHLRRCAAMRRHRGVTGGLCTMASIASISYSSFPTSAARSVCAG